MKRRSLLFISAVLTCLTSFATVSASSKSPLAASERAAILDAEIDWSAARLIAVQDAGRYKTLDSFARESMTAMTGSEHLPGLSPTASLLEWIFNREAYQNDPIVRIRDRGVRIHLSAHFPPDVRNRIQETGYMSPRELADPMVESRIRELEPQSKMTNAMRRVRDSQAIVQSLDRFFRIVPRPGAQVDDPWFTVDELMANLPPDMRSAIMATPDRAMSGGAPIPGISESQALSVLGKWARLATGWQRGDVVMVQEGLDRLAEALPTLADAGVYPTHSQRAAEASYYAWGKFTWGHWIYLIGGILGVWALVTHWRLPRVLSIVLLAAALTLHAYGISLRWYILGRIPVANMFEAVVGSAWIGVALGLLAELRYRTRVFLVGAHVTGFLALILGGFVIPGGGTLTTMMGILDDVMLRIHTVLIIASYALIFLASVIAVVYLFGYYFHIAPGKSAGVGVQIAITGAALWFITGFVFQHGASDAGGFVKNAAATQWFTYAAVAAGLLLAWTGRGASVGWLAATVNLFVLCLTLAIGSHGFVLGMGYSLFGVGVAWAAFNAIGMAADAFRRVPRSLYATNPVPVGAGGIGPNGDSASSIEYRALRAERPILAGAAPGDEGARSLPSWLNHADWSHLIILNMVFVLLFVGIILGAVWADYSWGRPWGWDPKEVFALNTWIIYAILIHVRFVTRNRGLWTAWLSIAGCLMMAFNWCFVNFYIVGLHSYA